MEHWERIIKDKLDTYESPLPEDGFARLENALPPAKPVRRFRFVLGFTTIAAAAAVAVLFLLRRPDESSSSIFQNERLIAVETVSPVEMIRFSVPKPVQLSVPEKKSQSNDATEKKPDPITEKAMQTTDNLPSADSSKIDSVITFKKAQILSSGITPNQGRQVQQLQRSALHLKMAGIGTAGAGLIAATLVLMSGEAESVAGPDHLFPGSSGSTSRHYPPFRAGLSVGIPFSESTRITTGFVYSYFHSQSTSGNETIQSVHYLGLPLRLDWSFISRNRLDLYLGGGIEANQCLAATLSGKKMDHNDRIDFSLQSALGVQWKASEHIGLYLEPTLSWLPSAQKLELKTYRTEHPVMFSVAIGCRWILINK